VAAALAIFFLSPVLHMTSLTDQASAQAPVSRDDRDSLEREKLKAEVRKLQVEVDQLSQRQSVFGRLADFASVLTAIVTTIGSIVLFLLNRTIRKTQSRKLDQERRAARERETLELLHGLGHDHSPVRIASAAVLIQRLRAARNGTDQRPRLEREAEERAVLQALLSIGKDKGSDKTLLKVLGDHLVDVLGAVVKDGERPKDAVSPLARLREQRLDLQRIQLPEVYWRGVDARGVDFFEADLTGASLRNAFLSKAVFYNACLSKCVLRDADLSHANLQDADLRGADLRGANFSEAKLDGVKLSGAMVDERTVWPEGFNFHTAL
jgi:hypothetical protein